MREVVIEPQQQGKGRAFRATLLASVEADLLWTGGETVTDNMRPVWAVFGGSDNELRAFMANLMSGRKAVFPATQDYRRRGGTVLEILKSSGYQVTWQREEEGSLATLFLPNLFQIDPGMVDQKGAKFILLPTQTWHGDQKLDVAPLVRHARRCGYKDLPQEQLEAWAPIAFLFAAYLDRRTRCPLVADGRFYMQLLLACLEHKLASLSTEADSYRDGGFGEHKDRQYHEFDTTTVGLMPGLAFNADHVTIDKLLAHEVTRFFKLVPGAH